MTLANSDHQHTSTSERVWGAAYRIPPAKVAEVRAYLDIREINGYSMQYVPFHPVLSNSEAPSTFAAPIMCLLYIGMPDNPQFLGVQDPEQLAKHILKSRGPSGENKDYLYELETALVELTKESGDEHISDLVKRCKRLESGFRVSNKTNVPENEAFQEISLKKVGSTDEQEEIEK